jgi:GTP-binding protein EngB required for normal cell division
MIEASLLNSDELVYLTSALSLDAHPMKNMRQKLRIKYFAALEDVVNSVCHEHSAVRHRLNCYKKILLVGIDKLPSAIDPLNALVGKRYSFHRKKYYCLLLCDLSLVLLRESLIRQAYSLLNEALFAKDKVTLEQLFNLLNSVGNIPQKFLFATDIIKQYRENRTFFNTPVSRVIITSAMSAGKSTLINAISGKPLTRTSQEVCTGALSYIYNKPFEDDAIAVNASPLRLNVSYDELANADRSAISSISSFFREWGEAVCRKRVCLIDTPGVNSAINREHGKITRSALKVEQYDTLVYIVNAAKLGTDDEMRHLKWVSENIPKDKVVFVLNKVDDFKSVDDNIEISINGVKSDLVALGYENPQVYPLSAYFAFLLKQKASGTELTSRQSRDYEYYYKLFQEPEYDLSCYYGNCVTEKADSKLLSMYKKCGLYGLEKILFGGTVK